MKRKILWLLCVLSFVFFGTELSAQNEAEKSVRSIVLPKLPVGVAEWNPEGVGNHRAVVRVERAAELCWTRVAWRRIDEMVPLRGIEVVLAKTGERIGNALVIESNKEYGDILFESPEPGDYYLYYIPFEMVERSWNPYPKYLSQETVSSVWRERAEIAATAIREGKTPVGIERAAVIKLESNGEENLFNEMEIPMTEAEREIFLERLAKDRIVFFSESLTSPICMTEYLPLAWMEKEPLKVYELRGSPGKTIVFQLAAVAPQKDIPELMMGNIGFKDAQGKLNSSLKVRCLNLSGNNFQGYPLLKSLFLKRGHVLPLWCLLEIPDGTPEGKYSGDLIFSGWNLLHTPLSLKLEVVSKESEAQEAEQAAFSRLSWLDSSLGSGRDFPVKYPNILRDENVLTINNHKLRLTPGGLPGQIGQDLFALPMEFRLKRAGTWIQWTNQGTIFDSESGENVNWETKSYSSGLSLQTMASAEPDGFIEMTLELNATEEDFVAEDAQLVFSFNAESVPYFMGLGIRGGYRPDFLEWKWTKNANQFFWIGGVENGLYCKLQDRAGRQGAYFIDQPYQDWCGDADTGESKITMRPKDGLIELVISTGSMRLSQGEERIFSFHLMLTPFQQKDMQVGGEKIYSGSLDGEIPAPDRVVLEYDPAIYSYLNYPFHQQDLLREYIHSLNENKVSAHFRLGCREIPYRIPEFRPLWSLNHEIFTYTPAMKYAVEQYGARYAEESIPFIGNPWLCEHLSKGYSASWLSHSAEGEEIVTLGINPLSRWQNYYMETLRWLGKEFGVKGIRMDLSHREVTKRVRRVVRDNFPEGTLLDSITGNNLKEDTGMANPMGQYMEHLSLLDSISFSDGFSYEAGEDYYLVELSGVPFGINTSFDGSYSWRQLLYGNLPSMKGVDRGVERLWKLCDAFGIKESRLIGYWDKDCPVQTGDEEVLSSVYIKDNAMMIVLSSWSKEPKEIVLNLEPAERLGMDTAQMQIVVPKIDNIQESRSGKLISIPISAGRVLVAFILPQEADE